MPARKLQHALRRHRVTLHKRNRGPRLKKKRRGNKDKFLTQVFDGIGDDDDFYGVFTEYPKAGWRERMEERHGGLGVSKEERDWIIRGDTVTKRGDVDVKIEDMDLESADVSVKSEDETEW